MRMKLLDRYVLRELGPLLVASVGVFTFVVLVDQIFQLTDLVIAKGVPVAMVASLLATMVPSFLTLTLPFALLVATALTCGRLARDLEFTALYAVGVSPLRMFRAFLASALMLTCAVAAITLWINPWSYGALRTQLAKILRARAEVGIQERVFSAAFEKVIVYADALGPPSMLRRLLVSDERHPGPPRIIVAAEGRLSSEAAGPTLLRMHRGVFSEVDPRDPRRIRFVSFEVCDVNLSVEGPEVAITRLQTTPREWPLARVFQRAEIAGMGGRPSEGIAVRGPRLEAHKRLALPLVPVVFVLVAYPLAIGAGRRGRGAALALALVIAVSYYLAFTMIERRVLVGELAPWTIWLPNVGFGFTGLALMGRAARGPGDLDATVLSRARRLWAAWRRPDSRPLDDVPRGTRRRRAWPTILDLYLMTEYGKAILAGIGIAAGLCLVVELVQHVDAFRAAAVPAHELAQHVALRVVADVHDALPAVVLVATVFLFLYLARHRELDALKAAGISLYRVALPVLGIAAAVAAGAGVFQETVLPLVKRRIETLERVTPRALTASRLGRESKTWYRTGDRSFVRLADGGADRGGASSETFRIEVDRGFRTLKYVQPTAPSIVPARPATMTFAELRRYEADLRASGQDTRRLVLDLQARTAFPFVHLVFALLVIPIAARPERHHRAFGVAVVVLVLGGYWLVHAVAVSAGRIDLIPPLLAAWTANGVFSGIAALGLLRVRT